MKRIIMIAASIGLTYCGADIYLRTGDGWILFIGLLCLAREIIIALTPTKTI